MDVEVDDALLRAALEQELKALKRTFWQVSMPMIVATVSTTLALWLLLLWYSR